jgi:hypothetical protein
VGAGAAAGIGVGAALVAGAPSAGTRRHAPRLSLLKKSPQVPSRTPEGSRWKTALPEPLPVQMQSSRAPSLLAHIIVPREKLQLTVDPDSVHVTSPFFDV